MAHKNPIDRLNWERKYWSTRKDLKRESNRDYRWKRRYLGLCFTCPNRANSILCNECKIKKAAYDKERKKSPIVRQKQNEAKRRLYWRKKQNATN